VLLSESDSVVSVQGHYRATIRGLVESTRRFGANFVLPGCVSGTSMDSGSEEVQHFRVNRPTIKPIIVDGQRRTPKKQI